MIRLCETVCIAELVESLSIKSYNYPTVKHLEIITTFYITIFIKVSVDVCT